MSVSVDQRLLAASLAVCLASFTWGMRQFFTQPTGASRGMKVVRHVGTGTAILQFLAILHTPGAPANRAAVGALLYGCSLGLFWWAVHINAPKPLSAVFSRDLPVHLVTQGPYRLVRHPFYC